MLQGRPSCACNGSLAHSREPPLRVDDQEARLQVLLVSLTRGRRAINLEEKHRACQRTLPTPPSPTQVSLTLQSGLATGMA